MKPIYPPKYPVQGLVIGDIIELTYRIEVSLDGITQYIPAGTKLTLHDVVHNMRGDYYFRDPVHDVSFWYNEFNYAIYPGYKMVGHDNSYDPKPVIEPAPTSTEMVEAQLSIGWLQILKALYLKLKLKMTMNYYK